jgi:hypothetical protein
MTTVEVSRPCFKANGFCGAFCDFAGRNYLESAHGHLKRIAAGYFGA